MAASGTVATFRTSVSSAPSSSSSSSQLTHLRSPSKALKFTPLPSSRSRSSFSVSCTIAKDPATRFVWGGKPDVLVACVGGGSNAIGLFHEFVDDIKVRMIGVETVGPEHSFLKDMGRAEYYSVTDEEALEGMDRCIVFCSVISSLFHISSFCVSFDLRLVAFKRVSRLEGIIPALETSHALAHLDKLCPTLPDGTRVVLNFSGRGDKDVQTVAKYLEV
ncbi:hypothetical protein EUTSA_v10014630mg [Eutrema salsugineum]|uniref:Uncharacterized protein n=1 Tax=Eutrema salsugineum TaxID=72664 RepID=V4NAW3_EUTSA|nr:hypothetical protein EUTSA_v10014630mg [Eutrema salsugineum]